MINILFKYIFKYNDMYFILTICSGFSCYLFQAFKIQLLYCGACCSIWSENISLFYLQNSIDVNESIKYSDQSILGLY